MFPHERGSAPVHDPVLTAAGSVTAGAAAGPPATLADGEGAAPAKMCLLLPDFIQNDSRFHSDLLALKCCCSLLNGDRQPIRLWAGRQEYCRVSALWLGKIMTQYIW